MEQQAANQKKWNYTALAFVFPLVGMLMVMLVRGFTPFGNSSMLYSDMYHQYFPFFAAFRNALRSGDSLLYNWSVGLGMDYVGLISYYLASPLNLLGVLVPEGLLLQYFSLLVPIKLGLAGLFFAIFLKKTFDKNDLSISLFGSFYALCAWALGYQWNVMWLDTFALAPLVVLGMVQLLDSRKYLLYVITLTLSIALNYYIGLFTCIFILLLFFCYEICRWGGIKKFFTDLALMALFSLLAIGLTVFLELPTLAAMQTTYASVNQFPTTFRLNIVSGKTFKDLLSAMAQVAGNMSGGLEPTFKEGLPNLFCGVITNFLAFLYLTCPRIKVKEKLCAVFLLLFFNLSFVIRQLDYIWHGFHFTNMIPYRFSFLYSFVLLYMAYSAYQDRHKIRPWQLIFSTICCVALIFGNKGDDKTVLWAYNCGFLLLYLIVFFYSRSRKVVRRKTGAVVSKENSKTLQTRKLYSTSLLLGLMVIELAINLVNFAVYFTEYNVEKFLSEKKEIQLVVDHMNEMEEDELFFRTETTHYKTLNDGALYGYNGVTAFTSSANVKTTEFMNALGFSAKNNYNRYAFEEASPVSNLFLGLKYMIERDGNIEPNPYFDDVYQSGKIHLLKNNVYLPLGFLANPELASVDITAQSNRFLFQNTLFSKATGISEDVWHMVGYTQLSISGYNITIDSQSDNGHSAYTTNADNTGTLTYRYTADKDGFLCVDMNLPKRNAIKVYVNGEYLYSENITLPQMFAVSQVTSGDVVEIELTCKKGEKGTADVVAAILSDETFQNGYDILNTSTLTLTTFQNTLVEGTIHCDRDGLLYTSIPQNGNWSVHVDGEPAEIQLVGDAMIGVNLSKGEHTVTYRYRNTACTIGAIVSAVCLLAAVALFPIFYKDKFRMGKFKK